MIFSYRKLIVRLQYVFVFMALTIILYQVMMVVSDWIQPVNKYKAPTGHSVKVFGQTEHVSFDSNSISERLRLFYWYGE
ncbi:hypothetical protein A8709_32060 [Paenibacillus pectinilyticus]|uniref:DUF4227 domain-containing protein n=1 Tax=Paenibacillus pectinilyticus TaxID=512399 RepID=A0A1C0ZWH8_9BACL|nr:DUF4227 family protein [Paenibacillus pectinilyticus]OCT12462.1 hypothetical protein A8709_32060 [Paenibacillus pectinilyticus]